MRKGQVIDEVMLGVMRGPHTITREDVVEITCHGGIMPAKLVLETLLSLGARLALPGEFTKRAFINGRIDLAQAEAVADLIHSRTELALAAANEQLAGKLSQRINKLRDDMMHNLAHIEAHIDFPEEDIAPATREEMMGRLEAAIVFMDESVLGVLRLRAFILFALLPPLAALLVCGRRGLLQLQEHLLVVGKSIFKLGTKRVIDGQEPERLAVHCRVEEADIVAHEHALVAGEGLGMGCVQRPMLDASIVR
jgi:hypothetical protein